MVPVTQTRFYEPDQPVELQRGNCLQAVLASLLELPLEDVPHFVQQDVDSGGQLNWYDEMWKWLQARGWGLHGAELETHRTEHLMVTGLSPRGNGIHHVVIHHVVIYRDREMAHDPHPDRTGLLSIETCLGLHRLDDPSVRA